jgi:hypothetical protein
MLLTLGLSVVLLGTAAGSQGWQAWWSVGADAVSHQIVWDIRLPRSLGAWLGGALLGLAGAVAQGLFRNPLADPYLLGSASGASLGVGVYLSLWGGSAWAMNAWLGLSLTGAAFVGAVLAVGSTFLEGPVHFGLLCLAATLCGSGTNMGMLAIQRTAGLAARDSTERVRIFSWLGVAPSFANVLGPGVQLNSDCLDSARGLGLVAVDAARVVSRSGRLVVIEKSRLAAADCAAHAGKAPMQRGLGSTVQAPDSDDIWASSMDLEFKMDSCWKLPVSE